MPFIFACLCKFCPLCLSNVAFRNVSAVTREKNVMDMSENWMLKGGGCFKTLVAEKLCPLEGNSGS